MLFLIIGLGSMGKRRIRNLKELGEKSIIGFDIRDDRATSVSKEYDIVTFTDIKEALTMKPDVFIISTPPNHHIEYQELAVKNNIPFFCEAGISYSKKVGAESRKYHITACPSCTMRFNTLVKTFKEEIDKKTIGNVVAFTYHMGQYLPDWHPYEHIKDFYVGHEETSAPKEMIPFELCWLMWIFGDITEVMCMKDKLSSIDSDINDVYQIIVRFKSGILGHILIDVVSRQLVRKMRTVGEEGSIEFDFYEKEESIHILQKNETETKYFSSKDMYVEEMKSFIEEVKIGDRTYPFSLKEESKILKVLNSILLVSEKKHIVED